MDSMQAVNLAAVISNTATDLGYDVSPEPIAKRLENPGMLIGDTYRLVTEQLIPALIYYGGQLYDLMTSESELPQQSIEDRKVEAAVVKPQITAAAKTDQNPALEEQFFTPEWDGILDSEYKDALDTTPKASGQTETQKTTEEALVVSKKTKIGVKEKNKTRKNSPEIGFGSHVPSSLSRKHETDAEFINKVQNNLRRVEDPLKPKKTRKPRSSSRLSELAKPKKREADKFISSHQVEMNFRKSLRK